MMQYEYHSSFFLGEPRYNDQSHLLIWNWSDDSVDEGSRSQLS